MSSTCGHPCCSLQHAVALTRWPTPHGGQGKKKGYWIGGGAPHGAPHHRAAALGATSLPENVLRLGPAETCNAVLTHYIWNDSRSLE
mmetsp:Transcript_9411/g.23940  ORF Transcript_9411/g.23940 Transcript_9411/m.23940 type:complete len:87 (-) Transcript_9411:812-1072(-)